MSNNINPQPFNYKPWVPPFRYDRDGTMILDSNGHMIVDVRGWGFLTGQGALALSDEEAAKIQDGLGIRLTLLMNRDAELSKALGLLQAGNAAVDQKGTIVDKRENPEAVPVPPHELSGVSMSATVVQSKDPDSTVCTEPKDGKPCSDQGRPLYDWCDACLKRYEVK